MNARSFPAWAERLLWILGVALLYYGAARLGLLLAFKKTNASPVWPPSGFAFAAVLLLGYRVWPGIMIGAFIANLLVFLTNQVADPTTIVVASLTVGIGNTLEAVSGRFLLQRLAGARSPLDRVQDFFWFVVVALLMCLTSCTIGSTSLCLAGIVPWALYGTIWFTWWLGDVAGVLILTPTLLAVWQQRRIGWERRWLVERVFFFVMLFAVGQCIFAEWLPIGRFSQAYLLIPFLLWAVFRFGQREGTAAVTLVSGLAIWGTVNGLGPFASESLNVSLMLLLSFVCLITITMLLLAAALSERGRAEAELRVLNEELEQRVLRRTAELESTNKELESFAYSVSHDLRAPLRSIDGFSQAVLEDYGEKLDVEGNDYLQRVRVATQNMGQLIEDLLNLSRITRREMRLGRVDLSALVQRIAAELQQTQPERQVEFVIQEGMDANGDSRLLQVALENLLNNAWKFTSRHPRARIEFGAMQVDGKSAYFVSDDGAGFDMTYAEKLFGAFQRLHSEAEFPGTGIGLATVQRIVHRHGGQVWAEGEVEKGATFYFVL